MNVMDKAFNKAQFASMQNLMNRIHEVYYMPRDAIIDGQSRDEYLDELIKDLDMQGSTECWSTNGR